MNTGTLRKDYDKLTPFERAAMLIKEATGRQRETESKKLAANGLWEGYWMQSWNSGFTMVGMYAVMKATQAERAFWMMISSDFFLRANAPDDNAIDALRLSIGWRRALEKLEADTGAPFIAATKMFSDYFTSPDNGNKWLDHLLEGVADDPLDFATQYDILSKIWASATDNINDSDEAHRWKHAEREGSK